MKHAFQMNRLIWVILAGIFYTSWISAQDIKLPLRLRDVYEPVFMFTPATNGGSLIFDPDGRIRFFYRPGPGHEGSGAFIYEDISYDGGENWHLGQLSLNTGDGSRSEITKVHPNTGEIYMMYTRGDGYMIRTVNNRSTWGAEKRLPFQVNFTTGSFMWLKAVETSGFHRMIAAVPAEGGVVSYLSDDDGETWEGPSNIISSPEFPGRWDNPAGSPQIIELENEKLWMLTRNSQDQLWECFSDDWGRTWTEGRPSRFTGVFSNVQLQRIPDGRMIIIWLNSMPRTGVTKEDSFHNTARDVLHVAISEDEGWSWRGFREVMLDKRRHELVYSRIPAYDAGIHHQKFAITDDNKVVVFSGQDDDSIGRESEHRQAVIFDIGWLYERSRFTDFSNGYEDLCVFKLSRKRYDRTNYYSRILGASLIGHPTDSYQKVLQLGREKCEWVFNEQDGACWNFPIGKTGSLEARVLLRKGFKGGLISLTNCFYNPSDPGGEEAAMFVFDIPADGKINVGTTLETDRWYNIKLEWNGTSEEDLHFCKVFIDGSEQAEKLILRNVSQDGICYVRFRSTAEEEDLAGFLIDTIRSEANW